MIPLSHDHHHGLVAAGRLKRGEPAHAGETLAASVAHLWRAELAGHFRIEEELIVPATRDIRELRDPVERMLTEHRRIREVIEKVAGEDSEDARRERARELGDLLESHIRFEERDLFPMLELSLTPEVLDAIGGAITSARDTKA